MFIYLAAPYIHTYIVIDTYLYTYLHTYIHTHTYLHMHTHTHSYIGTNILPEFLILMVEINVMYSWFISLEERAVYTCLFV